MGYLEGERILLLLWFLFQAKQVDLTLMGGGVCQSSSNEILVVGPHQSEKKLSLWVKELRLYLEHL